MDVKHHVYLLTISAEQVNAGLHNGGSRIALRFTNGETSWHVLKSVNHLEYTSPWILRWYDMLRPGHRACKIKGEVVCYGSFSSPPKCLSLDYCRLCVWGVVSHWHRGVACECGVSPMSVLAIQNLQRWGSDWAGGRAVSAGSMFRAMSWLDGAPEIVLIQMAEPLVTDNFLHELGHKAQIWNRPKGFKYICVNKGFCAHSEYTIFITQ